MKHTNKIQLLSFLLLLCTACAADPTSVGSRAIDGSNSAHPVLKSVTPNEAAIGATVILTGHDLGASGTVYFAGVVAKSNNWTATTVSASVPTGAGTSVSVEVNGVYSNALPFALLATGPSTEVRNPPPGNTPVLPTGSFEGWVLLPDGTVASSSHVQIFSDQGYLLAAVPEKETNLGQFTINLPPGTYFARASDDLGNNNSFFDVDDRTGHSGAFDIVATLSRSQNIQLEEAATATVQGTISFTGGAWLNPFVASWDLNQDVIRHYSPVNAADGSYTLSEVTATTVAIIAFSDLNHNGIFDFGVEPATVVDQNLAVTVTVSGVSAVVPELRTISGTIISGADGWTMYAEDRTSNDPSGNSWIAGSQKIPVGGTFSFTGFTTSNYRLRLFKDLNGNGVEDPNEPNGLARPDVNASAGDMTGLILDFRPQIEISTVVVISDTSGDRLLQSGETAILLISFDNLAGDAINLSTVVSAVQNVTVNNYEVLPSSFVSGAAEQITVEVTVGVANPGEQIEIDVDLNADGGYNRTRTIFVSLFDTEPYTLISLVDTYTDISANPNTIRLGNAESDENSEFVDFQTGSLFIGSDFAFPFYAVWQTDPAIQVFGNGTRGGIEVGDNGYLSFMRAADVQPILLPSADRDSQGVIAPAWDDMYPGTVSAIATGSAPDRILTIQWSNLIQRTTGKKFAFQVRLHETTGTIDILYQTVEAAPQTWGINYGDGNSWLQWPQPSSDSARRLLHNF